MNKNIYIFFLLFGFKFAGAQTYNLDSKFTITIPKRSDWRISTQYCDTAKNIYQFLQLSKNIASSDKNFSDITIKYEESSENIIIDQDNRGCLFGVYSRIDTVNISGYKTKRWFGVNCNWTKKEPKSKEISGYSVNMIINLEQNKYLRIMSSYFSPSKKERNLMEADLLSIINEIQISGK